MLKNTHESVNNQCLETAFPTVPASILAVSTTRIYSVIAVLNQTKLQNRISS